MGAGHLSVRRCVSAPILALFREHLDISDAADHYKKWTDRYTLTKSWQFRSGYRFKARKDRTNRQIAPGQTH